MAPIPKSLNHKALRRAVNKILFEEGGYIKETQHAEQEHLGISTADIVFGLRDNWTETNREFDMEFQQWKYTVRTLGVNDKWFKICFVINEGKKEIRIVTRYQNEFDRYGRRIVKARLSRVHREKNSDD